MLKPFPFYLRFTIVLLGLVLCVACIFYLKAILAPLTFGLFLALLLNPLVNYLQKVKVNRVLAIAMAVVAGVVVLGIAGYVISTQLSNFSTHLPLFKQRMFAFMHQLQVEVASRFNYDINRQNELISEAKAKSQPFIGQTMMTAIGGVAIILLVPLYAFLFLYYKELVLNFLYEVFAERNSKEVSAVLLQTKTAVQSYMFGLLLEGIIVACLNSIALMILGVQYAILLGVLGAMINVLPFIGGIVSVMLPMVIAAVTMGGVSTLLGITFSYLFIQFVDNHFLIPYIVSSRVRINALCSIVIVLLGGMVWGISGMFLAIPFVGVLKIIFDSVPELKAWGKLLGDEVPVRHIGQIWAARKRASAK